MKEAYIVNGYRTAVGKADGALRFMRPDDLAVAVIEKLIGSIPGLEKKMVDDVIVGNAVPEADQGLQIGRMIALRAIGLDTPGMVVNRYCASGVEAIAIAAAKIRSGTADCIIAGGAESMSLVPTIGWKTVPGYQVASTTPDYYLSMGLTAEEVAKDFNITREDQDAFSYRSHKNALNALKEGYFREQIVPIEVEESFVEGGKNKTRKYVFDTDEGPRADTSLEALSKLKPVFAARGTVTAGNSSQRSDGAAFAAVMSEELVKRLGVKPVARFVAADSAGVDPRVMGIGPVAAVPRALKRAGMKLQDIDLVELNEAFASQSVAVIRELGMDPEIVNVNGGAIALGHPLGCTGCKLTVQLLNELKRRNKKYGMVTLCVGGGQGIAGIFERL